MSDLSVHAPAPSNGAIQIAVVGHTNAGKTSLLRTLTRRASFGEVSDRAGTTRHVEAIDLRVDGAPAVRFFDTPGLEDSVALWDYLQALDAPSRLDAVRLFLQGPEARASFEQEAKVVRKMLDVDAAFYVIDCREPVLPKHRCEIEILASCARPVMPVLNFVRDAASREAEWQAALAASGLHAQARFDAVAPFVGSELQLYQDLATLLPALRARLRGIAEHLQREAAARRQSACRAIADLLVRLCALRRGVPDDVYADEARRRQAVHDFQQLAFGYVRATADALLQIHGFRDDDAVLAQLPWQDGRWASDLFHPETLRQAGKRLGVGAAVGASIGVAADLAVAGVSLGAGAALGGAIGGIASQGWRQFGGKLLNRIRGVHELTLDNELLFLVAMQLLGLTRALDQRGHAALGTLVQGLGGNSAMDQPLKRIVHLLQPARSHPEWETPKRDSATRQRLVDAAAAQLDPLAITLAP